LLYADIRYCTRYGVKYFKKCNIFEFCKNVENVKGLKGWGSSGNLGVGK
jgi:hypothetical protein